MEMVKHLINYLYHLGMLMESDLFWINRIFKNILKRHLQILSVLMKLKLIKKLIKKLKSSLNLMGITNIGISVKFHQGIRVSLSFQSIYRLNVQKIFLIFLSIVKKVELSLFNLKSSHWFHLISLMLDKS